MADSKVINRPNSANSPPPNCAICLGSFTNKCFSDSCVHQFCFKCLLEWSKIKAECPLCKQPFKRIIHNFKSYEEYDEHIVDTVPHNEQIRIFDNEEIFFLPLGGTPQPPTRHHFHFRTTFTVDTRGEHAIQQMLLTHPLTNGGQISIEGYPSRNVYQRRRQRENYTTTSFRRSIYRRNLWVNALADVTGRYREVSPSFFRDCPGARTRLVPWLNRELNALLYENTQLVMHLVDIIMDLLLRHHICSRTFRNLLYEYLDTKTDHFIHEFYNFMRSPFDMIGYDRYVTYSERPRSPPYVVTLPDELSDSNDSDVIIVGATSPPEPVVIDLVNDDTDSDDQVLVQGDDNVPAPMLPIQQTITISEDNTDRCSRSRSPSPPMITLQETSRPTALPPKLRFKVGVNGCCRNGGESSSRDYRSRSSVRSRRKRKPNVLSRNSKRRQRSRSSSSSSSSSSSTVSSSSTSSSEESPRETHKRYKEKKKLLKKLIKAKRPRSPDSSDSDIFIEKSVSSDSDVPLSTLKGRKKQFKKFRKSSTHPNGTSKHSRKDDKSKQRRGNSNAPVSTVTSNDVATDLSLVGTFTSPVINSVTSLAETATSSLPSCSKYESNHQNRLPEVIGTPLNLVIGNRHEGLSCDSRETPSCSMYQTHSQYRSTNSKETEGSDPVVIKFDNSSAEEDYPLKQFVKREIKEEDPPSSNKTSSSAMAVGDSPPQKLCRGNGRLRKIFIKKEESTNMWYSFPRNYETDSSSN